MTAMKLVFSYRLIRPGWAECFIADGKNEAHISVWHLTPDALGDLLRAIIGQFRGIEKTRCVWEEEQAEYRWIFCGHDQLVDITITKFDVPFSILDDDQGRVVFSTACPLTKFASKVRNALRCILHEIGLEGYEQTWHGRFPDQLYATLCTIMQEKALDGA